MAGVRRYIDDEAECSDDSSDLPSGPPDCHDSDMQDFIVYQDESTGDGSNSSSSLDESAWAEAFEREEHLYAERRAAQALRELSEVAPAPPGRAGPPADGVGARPEVPDVPMVAAAAAAPASAAVELRDAVNALRGPRAVAEAPYDLSKKCNRVVFTINNPAADVVAGPIGEPVHMRLQGASLWAPEVMNYLVYQFEKGEQGTTHIQGYCRFKNRMRLRTMQQFFPRGHIEPARGNEQQCKDYCTKEDTRYALGEEFGTFDPDQGKQGKRSDLAAIAADCAAGKPIREIAAAYPGDWIRYHAGIESLHDQLAPKPPLQRQVTVEVYWGETRTGKTHRVLNNPAFQPLYMVKPGRGPWDRYRGETTIFFDEFDYTKWEIYEMNQYLDKWACGLSCRYRDQYAAWTRVLICANSSPLTWYPYASLEVSNAFRRRLGSGCRHIVDVRDNPALLPADPDFSELNPPLNLVIVPDSDTDDDNNPAPQANP